MNACVGKSLLTIVQCKYPVTLTLCESLHRVYISPCRAFPWCPLRATLGLVYLHKRIVGSIVCFMIWSIFTFLHVYRTLHHSGYHMVSYQEMILRTCRLDIQFNPCPRTYPKLLDLNMFYTRPWVWVQYRIFTLHWSPTELAPPPCVPKWETNVGSCLDADWL